MTSKLREVFFVLKNNIDFVKKVDESVNKILSDGKIDMNDIPEIILIITESYNAYTTIKISQEDLPIFIKIVIDDIVKKNNLISEERKKDFDKYVEMAIKLVMVQPRVQDVTTSCFQCLDCLPCVVFKEKKYESK